MTDKVEKKIKKSPHLALCSMQYQKGSANGRNVSLLMKSDIEVTPEIAELIEKVTGEQVDPSIIVDVEKASYNHTRDILTRLVRDTHATVDSYGYKWSYVVDFDDDVVVFGTDNGLFYTTYEVSTDGSITIGDEATPVTSVVFYQESDNKLVLSNDTASEGGVQSLIIKSLDSLNSNDKMKTIIKDLQEGKGMQEEVQKATALLQEQLEKSNTDLKAAMEKIEALEKAAKESQDAVRKTKIAEVEVDADKAEALFKATESLDDEALDTILKSLAAKQDVVEKGDLFQRQSEQEDIEKADAVPAHVALLKEKYKQQ